MEMNLTIEFSYTSADCVTCLNVTHTHENIHQSDEQIACMPLSVIILIIIGYLVWKFIYPTVTTSQQEQKLFISSHFRSLKKCDMTQKQTFRTLLCFSSCLFKHCFIFQLYMIAGTKFLQVKCRKQANWSLKASMLSPATFLQCFKGETG